MLCAVLIWLVSAQPTIVLEHVARQGTIVERLTLFADGMAVWHSRGGLEPDRLVKQRLSPEEVTVYRDALAASGIGALREGNYSERMEGPVLRRWTLSVALPGASPRSYEGSGVQVVPLALGNALTIVEDLKLALLEGVREVDPFEAREPVIGDLLLDPEGGRWEVRGIDGEAHSLQLKGLDQPMTRYVKREDLKKVFKGYADLPGHP